MENSEGILTISEIVMHVQVFNYQILLVYKSQILLKMYSKPISF